MNSRESKLWGLIKGVKAAAVLLLIVSVAAGMAALDRNGFQSALAEKIVRFHVMANSDTAEDQALKLKVRDAVGAYLAQKLEDAKDREDCERILKSELSRIEEEAENVIGQEGYDYQAKAVLADVGFPEKTYGPFTFPAGTYEALEISIGEGAGHNWWCVLYPNMCFSGAAYTEPEKGQIRILEEALTEEEIKELMETDDYEIRFKYLTFLNDWL